MPTKKAPKQKHIVDYKNGSVWAKGQKADGFCVGFWEWFRLDGTRMRAGYFEDREQIGEWTTYDKRDRSIK